MSKKEELKKLKEQIETKKRKQIEFLKGLSAEDRAILASIIREAEIEGDYSGMDEDGGSFWEQSASETLSCLAHKIEKFDAEDIHW